MKVTITHHQFKLKGGMENYLFNLITGFKEHQDTITTFIYKRPTQESHALCQINHTNLTYLPRPLRKFWFGWQSYKKIAQTDHDLSISLMRAINHDLIICGGTHWGFLTHTQKKPSLLDKIEIQLEQKSYDTAKVVMAHSQLIKDELIKFYNIPEEKIITLYPPVDTRKLHQLCKEDKLRLRAKYNIHPTKTILLFPSTGHKRKGFFLLVEAMKQLPAADYELVVAGNQPPDVNLPNCTYVGFVEDMVELYSACDITVLPSYYEPFGLVAIESLQCGTPVILSEFVGAKELISDKEGIIMSEQTATALKEAILLARSKSFQIEENCVEKKRLTIADHIQQIKTLLMEQHG
jgi:glycosyltransferase involved in cell wall biosynthesis